MPVDLHAELQGIATALDLRCTDANSGRCELCGRSAKTHATACPIGRLDALLAEADRPRTVTLTGDCATAKRILYLLTQAKFCTPEEGYGEDLEWAFRDLKRCLSERGSRDASALLLPRAEVEALKAALKQIVALEAPGDALDGLHALDVAETAARFAASALALLDRGDQRPAPPPGTCPKCGHAAHGSVCLNLASDHDCSCTEVSDAC